MSEDCPLLLFQAGCLCHTAVRSRVVGKLQQNQRSTDTDESATEHVLFKLIFPVRNLHRINTTSPIPVLDTVPYASEQWRLKRKILKN